MNIFEALQHTLNLPEGGAVFLSAAFAAILLLVAGLRVRAAIATASGGVVPDEGLSVRNVFELIIEFLGDLSQTTMGEAWKTYFPIVGTIFFFVLVSNLLNLIPFLEGPTLDRNVTFAWAVVSFLVYNFVGIRQHGLKYIYQFMGPSIWNVDIGGKMYHVRLLAPIFLPLELVLHLARILTLGVRLLANMFADHTVVTVWLGLVPMVVPAIFMGLGLLVCFLQAFVFALLTMIYIGQALEEAH